MKKYLLSSDNGYHWHTSIYFDNIEDAVIYHVNEQIEDYLSDWKEISIKEINRPYYDKSSIVVIISVIDVYEYNSDREVYMTEMESIKPINRYNVKQLNK